MADSTVTLNTGSGGALCATYTDTSSDVHQKIIMEMQSGSSDPVKVNATNPMPITGTATAISAVAGNLLCTASQGGSWTVTVNGVIADATAFTRGTTVELPVGGVVEAVQSGLTVAQTRALSLTTAALLRVDGSNVTQPISGAVSQTGTWNVTVNQAIAAGTNAIGSVNLSPVTGQGWPSIYTGSIGATVTSVKASSGTIGGWYIYNANASVAYVQIFNVASGSVTLGTTAPTMSIGIPASGAANLELANGLKFGTAITIAVTTTRAGSTAPGSTVDINIWYD